MSKLAIHEWCSDSNYTPYLSVKVDANTRVPMEYVKNGEIVLNLSYDATHRLTIGNELIQFSARFNGVSRECSIPVEAVIGVFAASAVPMPRLVIAGEPRRMPLGSNGLRLSNGTEL